METGRKPPPWQWGLLVAMMAACFMVYLDTTFRQFNWITAPPTKKELEAATGQLSEVHQEFIDLVSKELGVKNKVNVFMLPALIRAKGGKLHRTETSFVILIEYGFFLRLNKMEQKALLAHEMGHIIYVPPILCFTYMSCQKGADQFAALHTSPDATIGLLNKLFDGVRDEKHQKEHRARVQNIERLKQGQ